MAHDEDILRGAAAIADELIERLRAIGMTIAPRDIEWNGGRGLLPAPEFMQLKVRCEGASVAMRVFKRGELEDAARRLTPNVQHQINQIVSQYACLAKPPAVTPVQPPKGG